MRKFLLVLLALFGMITLASCELGNLINPPAHEHNFTNYVSDNNAT